jgi:hypothetical protein
MKIQRILNTTFIFQMIIDMIRNSRSIVSNFIGNIWWNKDMHMNGIGCGWVGNPIQKQ